MYWLLDQSFLHFFPFWIPSANVRCKRSYCCVIKRWNKLVFIWIYFIFICSLCWSVFSCYFAKTNFLTDTWFILVLLLECWELRMVSLFGEVNSISRVGGLVIPGQLSPLARRETTVSIMIKLVFLNSAQVHNNK